MGRSGDSRRFFVLVQRAEVANRNLLGLEVRLTFIVLLAAKEIPL
jgi:hypothetical protein